VEEKRLCNKCGVERPLTDYYPSPGQKNGIHARCKFCHREYQRSLKLNHPQKQWKKANKNHYPDPDWVWTQLENNVSGVDLCNKIEEKYELKTHGNKGKKHKPRR